MSEQELREAWSWICKKLGIPESTRMFQGETTMAGTLHVVCSRAYGYQAYIEAFKCDDLQGEIARLKFRISELEDQLKQSERMSQ